MSKVKFFHALLCCVWLLSGCDSAQNGDETASQVDDNASPLFQDAGFSGEALFAYPFSPQEGLGPHFNARSCSGCHEVPSIGGVGNSVHDVVFRVGTLVDGVFDDLSNEGGPTSRQHSVVELGFECAVPNGMSLNVNVVSVRNNLSLFGLGVIDQISDAQIEAEAVDKGYGIHGRIQRFAPAANSHTVGRFGWKDQKSGLFEFVAEAFRNEAGMTNAMFAHDNFAPNTPGLMACAGYHEATELSMDAVAKVSDFIASLPILHAGTPDFNGTGYQMFEAAKCHLCHKPSYEVDATSYALFSDLLLHDMGDGLNDGFVQGSAQGKHWRTAPLHGLGFRTFYLHDARTTDLVEAIREHRGEADQSIALFNQLDQEQQDELIAFLKSL